MQSADIEAPSKTQLTVLGTVSTTKYTLNTNAVLFSDSPVLHESINVMEVCFPVSFFALVVEK